MKRALRDTLPEGSFVGVSHARSRTMSAIRGRNNLSTEIQLKMAFVRAGVAGWCLHPREIIGCPDFMFRASRLLVFVDGCFWHGCKKCGHTPRTNRAYWEAKIGNNKQRDQRVTKAAQSAGYRVLRFWEHEITRSLDGCLTMVVGSLNFRTNRKI